MKNNRLAAAFLICLFGALPAAAQPRLKYVVIVSRHGVRAPTWESSRLNEYSAQPWPDWGVPPADLTPHGRVLIKLMGDYYRDWLTREHLLSAQSCNDAGKVYIWADTAQRTLETGRALAESIVPGCGLAIHSRPKEKTDPLFSGFGNPDPKLSLEAVRDRLGPDSQKFLSDHRAALDTLQFILTGGGTAAKKIIGPKSEVSASIQGKSVDLEGPFADGSSLSEDLLLEYTNGMSGADLGWGRMTQENLLQALEVHKAYTDLIRRTPYIARARGSNLAEHVLRSIEQAATGKKVLGALDHPGNSVLILVGHDTNLSNLSGMLGLSWHLQGYQPDDTPPGGALIFSLWQDSDSAHYFVRTQYAAQTPDQMRNTVPLTMSAPPEEQDVSIPGCDAMAQVTGCSWPVSRATIQKAIDPAFVSIETPRGGTP